MISINMPSRKGIFFGIFVLSNNGIFFGGRRRGKRIEQEQSKTKVLGAVIVYNCLKRKRAMLILSIDWNKLNHACILLYRRNSGKQENILWPLMHYVELTAARKSLRRLLVS